MGYVRYALFISRSPCSNHQHNKLKILQLLSGERTVTSCFVSGKVETAVSYGLGSIPYPKKPKRKLWFRRHFIWPVSGLLISYCAAIGRFARRSWCESTSPLPAKVVGIRRPYLGSRQ